MKIIIILAVIILILVGVYFWTQQSPDTLPETQAPTKTVEPPAQPEETQKPVDETKTILGTSVEKRDITAYHYGSGAKELLFVGGIHGGYSWNTALIAYELMDYLGASPKAIPQNLRVTVIPVLNPDGLYKVIGATGRFLAMDVTSSKDTQRAGRFNAHGVDLNRNFDCDWQAKGVWQNTQVSGGTKAFSEPESQAFKNYIETHSPAAVVVWYSSAGGVFASNCHNGVSSATRALTNAYAAASGYKAYDDFNFYEITGDVTNWLAKKNIPAISVLLTTHEATEWTKNQAGVEALLKHYEK